MRVLVAPQEFKGSLTAAEAADAMAAGIREARLDWEIDLLPMSDGGPGFIDALAAALGGERREAAAHDALMRPIRPSLLWLAHDRLAVVESAAANGLTLIAESERDPLHADTQGVGELIAAALGLGPAELVVGVGGSATTDGGHGMARALGARFLDGAGRPLPPGGAALLRLERIDWEPPPGIRGVAVTVACDVRNPLTGPHGAAAVYGPQKGASAADVDVLDAALTRYAAVLRQALGVDVESLPGAGAAGGLAAGLVAFLGARLESGFDIVARVSGLETRLARADVAVTGEGSFDAQSLQGKTTGRLVALAEANAKPVVVFAGTASGDGRVRTLASIEPDAERSMREARPLLVRLAREWAAGWGP
jgi:glycerate kinase